MRRVGFVAIVLAAQGVVYAQSASTGTITGRVVDVKDGAALAGVTVVAQGPQGDKGDITDADGHYAITDLVPGKYVLRMYTADSKAEREVDVAANAQSTVNLRMAQGAPVKYVIPAPHVDTLDTKKTWRVDQKTIQHVPMANAGIEGAVATAPTAIQDPMGYGLSGSPAAENNYMIGGVNVTSVHMSQAAGSALGSALNLDFVQEVEIITGGYNAEYGRATGGVVNVITKSGSNEFHGDVRMTYDAGPLRGNSPRVSFPGQSISSERARPLDDYRLDFFADLGGPIVKDRLWFYVGIEPIFAHTTTTRIVSALVDDCTQSDGAHAGTCTGGPDGVQDFVGGVYRTRELYRSDLVTTARELQWAGKLNFNATPEHTLELAYYGSPSSQDTPRLLGTALPTRLLGGSQDAIAHWVSKLFDHRWQLEAQLAYHRERSEHELLDPVEAQPSITWVTDPSADTTRHTDRQGAGPSLSWFAAYEDERVRDIIAKNCDSVDLRTGTKNTTKLNVVCPVAGYTIGGAGQWEDLIADRIGTRLMGSNFFRLAGHHQLLYGWDAEVNGFRDTRLLPGGGAVSVLQSGSAKLVNQRGWGYFVDQSLGPSGKNIVGYPIQRDANYRPMMGPDGKPLADYSQCDDTSDIPQGASVFCADTQTINHALFLRDSWSLLPNLTLNLGLRWERQQVSGVSDWENKILGDSPMVLDHNFAPRVGAIWDPTADGRAKVYGSFARFYESIPLDINNRSFGQEGLLSYIYRFSDQAARYPSCREGLLGQDGAPQLACALTQPRLFGGEKSLIEPDLQAMYTDEFVIGGEYEIIQDLALGGYYTHRQLGTIIEDGSVDNAQTYYITNPGEKVTKDQVNTLVSRAAAARAEATHQMTTGNMVLADDYNHLAGELSSFADNLPYFGNFEKPRRDYDALTLTARRRFSGRLQAQASYTYARTIGNYPGIYNPYIDQRDPNISQMYDLPDLLINRVGPLPTDIPHQFKIDGYYLLPLRGASNLVIGTSFRAQSGPPRNTLGVNQIYQPFPENFLLPAGSGGRNDVLTSWDLQLAYMRQLPHNMQMQIFFAAYNLLDTSTATTRNDVWSTDYTAPIANGTLDDLRHLKTVNGAVAKPNASYGSPTSYQSPIFTRFGARFTF